jgi:hypothetical protein
VGGKVDFRWRRGWDRTAAGCARGSIDTMRAEGAFVLVLREDADEAPMMIPLTVR